MTDFGWIVFWTLFAFAVKAAAGILAVKVMGLEWKTALTVGFSIAQIGSFLLCLHKADYNTN
jgi:Kef-type K+ transport system membrane component KefB